MTETGNPRGIDCKVGKIPGATNVIIIAEDYLSTTAPNSEIRQPWALIYLVP